MHRLRAADRSRRRLCRPGSSPGRPRSPPRPGCAGTTPGHVDARLAHLNSRPAYRGDRAVRHDHRHGEQRRDASAHRLALQDVVLLEEAGDQAADARLDHDGHPEPLEARPRRNGRRTRRPPMPRGRRSGPNCWLRSRLRSRAGARAPRPTARRSRQRRSAIRKLSGPAQSSISATAPEAPARAVPDQVRRSCPHPAEWIAPRPVTTTSRVLTLLRRPSPQKYFTTSATVLSFGELGVGDLDTLKRLLGGIVAISTIDRESMCQVVGERRRGNDAVGGDAGLTS